MQTKIWCHNLPKHGREDNCILKDDLMTVTKERNPKNEKIYRKRTNGI